MPVTEQPSFREDQILSVALRFASEAGDENPSLIQHVAGPHDRAVLIGSFGSKVYDRTRCYLVAMRGSFVLHKATRPPLAKAPTGTVLTLYLNTETGAWMGHGLGDRYPDLDKLGQVATDLSQ